MSLESIVIILQFFTRAALVLLTKQPQHHPQFLIFIIFADFATPFLAKLCLFYEWKLRGLRNESTKVCENIVCIFSIRKLLHRTSLCVRNYRHRIMAISLPHSQFSSRQNWCFNQALTQAVSYMPAYTSKTLQEIWPQKVSKSEIWIKFWFLISRQDRHMYLNFQDGDETFQPFSRQHIMNSAKSFNFISNFLVCINMFLCPSIERRLYSPTKPVFSWE